MKKMYLRIKNNNFGFITEEIHFIKETDIEITDEDYNKFFEFQSEGKQFKLKNNPNGNSLFDYIEEYIPEVKENNALTLENRIQVLEFALLEVL